MSPALAGGFFTTEPPGKPAETYTEARQYEHTDTQGGGHVKTGQGLEPRNVEGCRSPPEARKRLAGPLPGTSAGAGSCQLFDFGSLAPGVLRE